MLIIGCGSPVRGDDAAGPEAARRLAAMGFDAYEVHQLTPELAEPIARARVVFFLDAHADVEPGAVSVIQVAEGAAGPLEHHATPAGLMRLARTAYGAAPKAWMVAIGGESFEFSERLSIIAEKAVKRAVKEVVRLSRGDGDV